MATKNAMVGTVIMTPAAMIMPQSTMVALKRSLTPTGSVFSSSEVISTSAKRKSFHARMKVKMAAAMRPGSASGNTTYQPPCRGSPVDERCLLELERNALEEGAQSQRQKGRQNVVYDEDERQPRVHEPSCFTRM